MLGRREVALLVLVFATAHFGPFRLPSVLANTNSPKMVCYGVSGSQSARYRIWNGSSWGTASSLPSFGGYLNWIVARNCPTRNETICGALDQSSDVNVCIYNGSSWGSVTQVTSDTATSSQRAFDMCYEAASGDLLIAYWAAASSKIGYRTYSGSSISSENLLTMPTTDAVRWVQLSSNPQSNSIMMLCLTSTSRVYGAIWSGTAWGSVTQLKSSGTNGSYEGIAGSFETFSGNAVAVYGESGSNNLRYRTWNGSAWSSEGTVANIGGVTRWARCAADPSSNSIIFAIGDDQIDLNTVVWDGSSWTGPTELATNLYSTDRARFDLAYEPQGSNALIMYCESGTNLPRYRTYSGGSWSSESSASDSGNRAAVVSLTTGTGTGEIFVMNNDEGDDLTYRYWNGSSLTSHTDLEGTLEGSQLTQSFAVSMPYIPALTPANTPYSNTFESTVGAEWSDSTVTNNATFTKFLGRYSNGTVKLVLNTQVGETYRVLFDLYAIDSWDGDSATYGPDQLSITANNSTIFSNTFTHEFPEYGASYPYPYDQCGTYGFTSARKDAIYRNVEAIFTASSTVTIVGFTASFTDSTVGDIDNESWGIDNVKVAPALFRDVSSAKGFNVTTSNNDWASGMQWGDLDGDGDLDALITGNLAKRLISNNIGTSFTSSAFGGGEVRRQAALLDIDNDGDLDLWAVYITTGNSKSLYQNNGSATFTNIGNLGFTGPGTNEACAAADVNGDGWIDMLMFSGNGNWIGIHQGNPGSGTVSLVGTTASSYGLNGTGNTGDGDFCSAGDVNNDGYLDFFYHYNSGRLFVSNGDGTYTRNNYNISVVTGTATTNKFGSAWADYDNDGDLDLFCAHREESYSGYLWRNDRNWSAGTGNFTDVTSSAGLTLNSSIDYTPDHYGTVNGCWGDYDNDGDLDLFILGGAGNNYLYENQGNGTFKRTGEGIIFSGLGGDCCFVDYDNDGDLDLAITRDSATTLLFENQTNNSNYLKVRIVGAAGAGSSGKTNKAGIGIRVDLYNAAGTTFLARRQIGVATGLGTEPMWVHFGGVNPATTYTVKVYFTGRAMNNPYTVQVVPGSVSTTIGSTVIPQMLTVTEPPTAVKIQKWYEVVNRAS